MTFKSIPALVPSVFILATHLESQAAHILTINIQNPSAVVITGTEVDAAADFSGSAVLFPIRLANFFTVASNDGNPTFADGSSTLTTIGGSALSQALVRFSPGTQSLVLRSSSSSSASFDQNEPAFTGSATFDMSSLAANFPSNGHIGNVLASDGSTIVGTYSVSNVPEPSEYAAIIALASLGFALHRMRTTRFS